MGAWPAADGDGGHVGHIFGKSTRKEFCYDNLHISRNAWDTNLVKASQPSFRLPLLVSCLYEDQQRLTTLPLSRPTPNTSPSTGSRAVAAHSLSFP